MKSKLPNAEYHFVKEYHGGIKAVICDWAGTVVDFGSLAPVSAFIDLFAANRIKISREQAREPMGTEKSTHIRQLLSMPAIQQQWQKIYGKESDELDIENLYNQLIPIQIEAIKTHATLISGTKETAKWLEKNNIALAGNTGYSREMLEAMLNICKNQGYAPQLNICAPEVLRGRPAPDMSLYSMMQLGIDNVKACIKVDDTIPGIDEGLNAGMWTVAVAISGNAVGLSFAEWNNLSIEKKYEYRNSAYKTMAASGAHYVIDSIAELPAVIKRINKQLLRGEKP